MGDSEEIFTTETTESTERFWGDAGRNRSDGWVGLQEEARMNLESGKNRRSGEFHEFVPGFPKVGD
jgi:hypothetical protein